MTAPKPQPKANLIHQLVLSGLLANKSTVREEVRGKTVKRGNKHVWVESVIDVSIPTFAGNVSEENVNRLAKRWAA